MATTTRLRIRHVLVADGDRGPGWYVVDTLPRPTVTVAGPFWTRLDAERALADGDDVHRYWLARNG